MPRQVWQPPCHRRLHPKWGPSCTARCLLCWRMMTAATPAASRMPRHRPAAADRCPPQFTLAWCTAPTPHPALATAGLAQPPRPRPRPTAAASTPPRASPATRATTRGAANAGGARPRSSISSRSRCRPVGVRILPAPKPRAAAPASTSSATQPSLRPRQARHVAAGVAGAAAGVVDHPPAPKRTCAASATAAYAGTGSQCRCRSSRATTARRSCATVSCRGCVGGWVACSLLLCGCVAVAMAIGT